MFPCIVSLYVRRKTDATVTFDDEVWVRDRKLAVRSHRAVDQPQTATATVA